MRGGIILDTSCWGVKVLWSTSWSLRALLCFSGFPDGERSMWVYKSQRRTFQVSWNPVFQLFLFPGKQHSENKEVTPWSGGNISWRSMLVVPNTVLSWLWNACQAPRWPITSFWYRSVGFCRDESTSPLLINVKNNRSSCWGIQVVGGMSELAEEHTHNVLLRFKKTTLPVLASDLIAEWSGEPLLLPNPWVFSLGLSRQWLARQLIKFTSVCFPVLVTGTSTQESKAWHVAFSANHFSCTLCAKNQRGPFLRFLIQPYLTSISKFCPPSKDLNSSEHRPFLTTLCSRSAGNCFVIGHGEVNPGLLCKSDGSGMELWNNYISGGKRFEHRSQWCLGMVYQWLCWCLLFFSTRNLLGIFWVVIQKSKSPQPFRGMHYIFLFGGHSMPLVFNRRKKGKGFPYRCCPRVVSLSWIVGTACGIIQTLS